MKEIYELSERKVDKEDLPDIYCDMDMVLCDFLRGADKAIGEPFIHADKVDRWKKINNTKGFWEGLDWYPGGKRLYSFIAKYDPLILSAYSTKDVNSRGGKLKWLSKNTKIPRGKTHLVLRSQKKDFAVNKDEAPNILIDDYMKNIEEFNAKGGIGIHHTDTGKTLRELKNLGFK